MSEKRKRQHPLWIILTIGKSIREVIIPIIYFFIINLQSDTAFVKFGTILLIAYMIYRIIIILFQWKNHTYLFTDTNLEIIEGRFISKKRYLSLRRIQSVQQHTSFFHRIFGLTSLSIMTGTTGDNASVRLEMITPEEADNVQRTLRQKQMENAAENSHIIDDVDKVESKVKHYVMSVKEIILISVTSLYFIAAIPIILSVYSRVEDLLSLETYTNRVLAFLQESWLIIGIVSTLTLIILISVGTLITYIRYGHYTVSSDDERIYITRGIFTKTSFSIPKDKINGVSITKGLIRQFFNIVEVELVIVGSFSDDTDVKTNILFPFISENRARKLLPDILPLFKIKTSMTSLPSPALFVILIRPSYFLVFVTVLTFFFWPELWYVPLILAVLIILSRVLEYKRNKYSVDDTFIQMQTGSFSPTLFITIRTKIDEFKMSESFIQQKLQLASISITTRGQPYHSEQISHIPDKAAHAYYQWYAQEQLASKNNELSCKK